MTVGPPSEQPLAMEQVTVTFDLIFDLRRRHSSLFSPWHTSFSFTAGGVTHRDLSVPGWPTLQVGHTVTALLRRRGDWQSLIGWVNHDTGEVTRPTSGRMLRRASWLMIAAGVLVALLHAMLMLDSGPVATGVKTLLLLLLWTGYGAFLLALAIAGWLRMRRRRRDERALERCLLSIEQRRAGSGPPAAARCKSPASEQAHRHAAKH